MLRVAKWRRIYDSTERSINLSRTGKTRFRFDLSFADGHAFVLAYHSSYLTIPSSSKTLRHDFSSVSPILHPVGTVQYSLSLPSSAEV